MANHSILMRDDGQAVAFGDNRQGQCCVPALPDGVRYVSAAAGMCHSLLLRSDGWVVACGHQGAGRCDVPELPGGGRYVVVAAGARHSVLVRSDGEALGFGDNSYGQSEVPATPAGSRYVAAAAGMYHSILVRDDGRALAFGINDQGQCDVPPLPRGTGYVAAASGVLHSVLLRDDGRAVAFGCNDHGQCDVPGLPDDVCCVAAAAGKSTSTLVLDTGEVVVFGRHDDGPQVMRGLRGGQRCVAAVAGSGHTVWVLGDGTAAAEGNNLHGQCSVPELPKGTCYVGSSSCQPQGPARPSLIATVSPALLEDGMLELTCTSMSGAVLLALRVDPARELLAGLRATVAKRLEIPGSTLRLVTPSGLLLAASDNVRPLAAVFGPFAPRQVSEDIKTVRVRCLEASRNSVSNTFHLEMPAHARGRALYQRLAASMPPSARILAGIWSSADSLSGAVEVQDDDCLPDEVSVTEIRASITPEMVLTKKQCFHVQQMLMEALQKPRMQQRLEELEEISKGDLKQYQMRLRLVLVAEAYSGIAASFGLKNEHDAAVLPFRAIQCHSVGDVEMCERGLWLEVLMRNPEAQVALRLSVAQARDAIAKAASR